MANGSTTTAAPEGASSANQVGYDTIYLGNLHPFSFWKIMAHQLLQFWTSSRPPVSSPDLFPSIVEPQCTGKKFFSVINGLLLSPVYEIKKSLFMGQKNHFHYLQNYVTGETVRTWGGNA